MDQFSSLGKTLIVVGIAIIIIGVLLTFSGKIPFLDKLPGDFAFKGKNWSFNFPMATSILLSVLLSLILYIIRKL